MPEPEPVPVPEPEPQPQPEPGPAPVPEPDSRFTQVDASYFDDAVFIGDSHTDGFMDYAGLPNAHYLCHTGLTVWSAAEDAAFPGGQTLAQALSGKHYGKIYMMLGINELGYFDDKGFYQAYCQAIDAIRACQPNAVIYIQGLIPLNESVVAASGGPSYLTNEHLRVYNGLMQKAAEAKQVVFLDLYSEFANENGELPEEASKDGVHLKSDYCKQWLEYLKVHTVDFETLYPEGTET